MSSQPAGPDAIYRAKSVAKLRRPGAKERRRRNSHWPEKALEIVSEQRREALAARSEEEIRAAIAFGLAAMRRGGHSPEKLAFLRGLMNALDEPAHCETPRCRGSGLCQSPQVLCYWVKREEVRAFFPQIDDALAQM